MWAHNFVDASDDQGLSRGRVNTFAEDHLAWPLGYILQGRRTSTRDGLRALRGVAHSSVDVSDDQGLSRGGGVNSFAEVHLACPLG